MRKKHGSRLSTDNTWERDATEECQHWGALTLPGAARGWPCSVERAAPGGVDTGLSGTLACPLVYLSNLPAEVDQRPWEESVREAVPSPKLWFSEEWDEVSVRGRVN